MNLARNLALLAILVAGTSHVAQARSSGDKKESYSQWSDRTKRDNAASSSSRYAQKAYEATKSGNYDDAKRYSRYSNQEAQKAKMYNGWTKRYGN